MDFTRFQDVGSTVWGNVARPAVGPCTLLYFLGHPMVMVLCFLDFWRNLENTLGHLRKPVDHPMLGLVPLPSDCGTMWTGFQVPGHLGHAFGNCSRTQCRRASMEGIRSCPCKAWHSTTNSSVNGVSPFFSWDFRRVYDVFCVPCFSERKVITSSRSMTSACLCALLLKFGNTI